MKMWKKKLDKWREKEITAEEAIKKIVPGNRAFIGNCCSES